MEFRIADTFTDSLARLTSDERVAAKTTAFDLQMNPATPGMQFHKLDRAKDKQFWSVRVTPMHSGVSGWSPTTRSWSGHSNTRGTSGRYSCIRRSVRPSNGTMAVRLA